MIIKKLVMIVNNKKMMRWKSRKKLKVKKRKLKRLIIKKSKLEK